MKNPLLKEMSKCVYILRNILSDPFGYAREASVPRSDILGREAGEGYFTWQLLAGTRAIAN